MRRMTLLINGDDTLWESNVFAEKTMEHFFSLVEGFGYARGYARHILNETERMNVRQHGYGVRSFGRSLEETYKKLAGSLAQPNALKEVSIIVGELERTPPRVLDGVPETLSYLASHHRMILFTRGEAAEQGSKVERSGLQGFFDAIEILPEITPGVFGELVARHHVVKSQGWVVGHSPRVDVNPALRAGLNVAFVPHPGNWERDPAELQCGVGKLLIVAKFSDLRDHF
jgi:putative hydrolase of the HAD superfamily